MTKSVGVLSKTGMLIFREHPFLCGPCSSSFFYFSVLCVFVLIYFRSVFGVQCFLFLWIVHS